jgi:hypothetical protein
LNGSTLGNEKIGKSPFIYTDLSYSLL